MPASTRQLSLIKRSVRPVSLKLPGKAVFAAASFLARSLFCWRDSFRRLEFTEVLAVACCSFQRPAASFIMYLLYYALDERDRCKFYNFISRKTRIRS